MCDEPLLQASLSKHTKRRLLSAWHDVYIHAVMKRFQNARAQGLYREYVEQRALRLWQLYCRQQQRKHTMLTKAHAFARCCISRISVFKHLQSFY